MSRLEELIQQYCPNGVEYKKIKEVYQRIKGTPITAGKMKEIQCPDGEIRIFAGGKTVIDANEADIPNANITRVPAVLVQSRGVIDAIYYDKPFTFKNEMWAYTHKEQTSVKFLYYVMKQNIQHFRDAASGMGALPQISLGTTEDFVIPVPPLPVQEEIVRILDTFTELQAELQAELLKRKQQYEYYRDKLLSFSDLSNWGGQEVSVEWKAFFDVCNFVRGITYNKQQEARTEHNAHKVLRANNITLHFNTLNFDDVKYVSSDVKVKPAQYLYRGDILMCAGSGSKEHIGKVAYIEEDMDYTFGGFMSVVRCGNEVLPRYMFHILTGGIFSQHLEREIKSSTINNINNQVMQSLVLPIPPVSVQQQIVDILDRFYTLTADLTAGLPAEIEARRKQYEYYRDRLLTFKQKA